MTIGVMKCIVVPSPYPQCFWLGQFWLPIFLVVYQVDLRK